MRSIISKDFETKLVGISADLIKRIRSIKDEKEIELIKRAVDIAEKAFEEFIPRIDPGLSELELAGILEKYLREMGSQGFAFSTIVAIGKNTSYPHYIPKESIVFTGSEPILIDFGARYMGYVSDITRMIIPSKLKRDKEFMEIVECVESALDRALALIREGIKACNVDAEARRFIEEKGYGRYFVHGLGHGLGVDVHEEPRIAPSNEEELISNQVFTVEPGIYLANKFGVRIEEDVVVKSTYTQILTTLPRIIEI